MSTEQEREAFEAAMRRRVGAGLFDQMADFWFDRTDDGSYEVTRMQDAWLGWQLAVATRAARDDALIAALREARVLIARDRASTYECAEYPGGLIPDPADRHAIAEYDSALAKIDAALRTAGENA